MSLLSRFRIFRKRYTLEEICFAAALRYGLSFAGTYKLLSAALTNEVLKND